MSQIMTIGRVGFLLLIGLVMLIGCGTPNDNAPFSTDTQKHATDWLPKPHMTSAQADLAACKECHGGDLLGGISGAGCVSCHMGGPTSMHPAIWSGVITTSHGLYVAQSGTHSDACRNVHCHGPYLAGVPNSGPSCSSCHNYP